MATSQKVADATNKNQSFSHCVCATVANCVHTVTLFAVKLGMISSMKVDDLKKVCHIQEFVSYDLEITIRLS